MKKGKMTVQRRTGSNTIDVTVTNDIMLYQMKMNGVDRNNHYRAMCTGFANALYLKNDTRKCQ